MSLFPSNLRGYTESNAPFVLAWSDHAQQGLPRFECTQGRRD